MCGCTAGVLASPYAAAKEYNLLAVPTLSVWTLAVLTVKMLCTDGWDGRTDVWTERLATNPAVLIKPI